MSTKACYLIPLFAVAMSLVGSTGYAQKYGDKVYNRFNIHYYIGVTRGNRTEYKASYANMVKPGKPEEHGFIPHNTEMTIGRWRGGFLITLPNDRQANLFCLQCEAHGQHGVGRLLQADVLRQEGHVRWPEREGSGRH